MTDTAAEGKSRLLKQACVYTCLVAMSACSALSNKPLQQFPPLPGPSVANHSAPIMAKALQRMRFSVFAENACATPEVYKVMALNSVPWETHNDSVVLKGPVFERWRVLACGLFLEVYMLFRPTEYLQEGFVVGISFRPSMPFELENVAP